MTSQEMMKHAPIGDDKLFVNIAPLGDFPDWQIQNKPADWDLYGNPNSAVYSDKLFGYDVKEFLRKQYK